jgi:hypothetical protein
MSATVKCGERSYVPKTAYDALAAELAAEKEFRAAERQVLIENADRIAQLEAFLRRVVERPNDPASWCADIVRLAPSAAATPLRRAHSKSEHKRLTALGVECAPPETQCPPCQLELGGQRCGDCGYPGAEHG